VREGQVPLVKRGIMARRRPSLGLFGVFGRSEDLRALDQALRAAGLHPALIPEAVKLTVLNVLKDARGEDPSLKDYGETAVLLGYCALGREVLETLGTSFLCSRGERNGHSGRNFIAFFHGLDPLLRLSHPIK
jgi:hypothetical protein